VTRAGRDCALQGSAVESCATAAVACHSTPFRRRITRDRIRSGATVLRAALHHRV